MNPRRCLALALLSLAACANTPTQGTPPDADRATHTPLGSVALPPFVVSPSASATAATDAPSFGALVRSLSEPDGPFFSDNTISNETSYLQIAAALSTVPPGGAYLGVGPEQNFTYLALTRPRVAFIVDIRRQNMVEHLLYKALFTQATSRSHFLALLLGRPFDPASDPGPGAPLDAVIAHAEKTAPTEASFARAHDLLRATIERDFPLDAGDKKTLEITHRTFFKGQLAIRFELKPPSGRRYPTLRELLTQEDPAGVKRGFLATEDGFRFVQTMEREGRVIPVVGDFAGDRALSGIAAYLVREKLSVSAFYVSNVEQYLLEHEPWTRWTRNVAALPRTPESVFIRAYLDQGKRHPMEIAGHRTATVLQHLSDLAERSSPKPYATFWDLTTDRVMGR